MRQLRLFLPIAPLFIIHSAANAQTPPNTPVVPSALSSNVVPKPDTSGQSAKPPPKFRVPDGFGGLKEVPDDITGQTGSTPTVPNQPLSPAK